MIDSVSQNNLIISAAVDLVVMRVNLMDTPRFTSYFNLFKSYLSDREFRTAVNGVVSKVFPIKSGVPQGSIWGPLFYLLYTSDIPTKAETTIGTLQMTQ
jgi:hypothetical protein